MKIAEKIAKRPDEFKELCANHNVRYLYAFGSAATDHYDARKSDIDLIVEIDDSDPIERGEKLISLWDTFEIFFQSKVDLLTNSSIRNPFLRKSIESTKVLIYDGSGQKVLI